MKGKIIVVGGYGKVGRVVCEELRKKYPNRIYAAGRNFQKAKQFSLSTNGEVLPLQLDVNEEVKLGFFDNVSMVIMCLDMKTTDFVRQCLDHRIDYIDVTADYAVMKNIEELRSVESTVVLSVGLAPGMTNLLTKQGTLRLDRVDSAEIDILLGLGEEHGRAAIEWTVDNLNAVYTVVEKGEGRRVSGYSDGKRTDFSASIGNRTAYRFNFADQHVLPRTLLIPSVATRLCFDSESVTNGIAVLKRLGLLGWLRYPYARKKVVDLMSAWKWGREVYAIKAEVVGLSNGRKVRYQGLLHGIREFYTTGRVAAYVANKVYEGRHPPGVFHIEELFEPGDLLSDLSDIATFSERIMDEP